MPEIEGRRQYLKEEELKSLIRLYDSEPELSYFERQVLRIFLFMCFTGIRFSDAMAIEDSYLYGNSLRFIPQKTKKRGKHLYIPLNDQAKKYL